MTQTNLKQHYRLSLEQARLDHQDGIITTTGLIYYAIGILRKPGHKLRVKDIEVFCADLKIGVSTFYKSIKKLKDKGRIRSHNLDGIELWIPASNEVEISSLTEVATNGNTESPIRENNSPSLEIDSPVRENNSPSLESNYPIRENKSLKASSDNDFSPSSTTYQLFINSLSDNERETFEKFVREEWKRLTSKNGSSGEEIVSLERFLSKPEDRNNWWQKFLKSTAGKAAKKEALVTSSDWRNDPRFTEWIWSAFNRGYEWVHEDEAERANRQAFYDWAFAVNAFEGICL